MSTEIRHCSRCLMNPGTCCAEDCTATPQYATLDDNLTEHIHCLTHASGQIAHKPLNYAPQWAPPGDLS